MLDFLFIGPPKSGTTLLQSLLIQNPKIFLSIKKEIQFFNYNYSKGIEWYHEHFKSSNNNQIIGEISPTYVDSFVALERIAEYSELYNSDRKIVFTFREPLKRLTSEYYHNIRRANYSISIEKAIEIELSNNQNHIDDKYYKIVRNSLYFQILTDLYSLFDPKNILVINSDKELYDVTKLPVTLKKIENFIGILPFTYKMNVEDNSAYIPRSYIVQKIMYQQNPIKTLLRKAIPSFVLRERLRVAMRNLNKKDKGYDNGKLINSVQSNYIFQKYLEEDFIKFKSIYYPNG